MPCEYKWQKNLSVREFRRVFRLKLGKYLSLIIRNEIGTILREVQNHYVAENMWYQICLKKRLKKLQGGICSTSPCYRKKISFVWLLDLWPRLDRYIFPLQLHYFQPSVRKICPTPGGENCLGKSPCVSEENLGKALEKAVLNEVCLVFYEIAV